MFASERDEGGAGDAGDGTGGGEADHGQGPEGDLEQRFSMLGHTEDAADDGVERPYTFGQFAALGVLDRVAEAVAGAFATEVGRGGDTRGDGASVQGFARVSAVALPTSSAPVQVVLGNP
ncbi:hypothetical protein [Streptomyces sp. NPDC059802]|uniref:hypothetical protein n=1 Tax=Streptomyces sp. NPDC059802 TaxID=3346952 RepID=UPI00364D881A